MSSSGDGSARPPRPEGRLRGPVDVDRIFREGVELDRAMRRAFRDVCFEHKQLGFPLVVWQDGRATEIPPDEIEVPTDEWVERGPA